MNNKKRKNKVNKEKINKNIEEIINEKNGYIIPGVNVDSIEQTLLKAFRSKIEWPELSTNAIFKIKEINSDFNAVNSVIKKINS